MHRKRELEASTREDLPKETGSVSVSCMRPIGHAVLLCLFSLLLASCGGGGGGGNGQDTGDLPEAAYKVHDLLLAPASTGVYVTAHCGAYPLGEGAIAEAAEAMLGGGGRSPRQGVPGVGSRGGEDRAPEGLRSPSDLVLDGAEGLYELLSTPLYLSPTAIWAHPDPRGA